MDTDLFYPGKHLGIFRRKGKRTKEEVLLQKMFKSDDAWRLAYGMVPEKGRPEREGESIYRGAWLKDRR